MESEDTFIPRCRTLLRLH